MKLSTCLAVILVLMMGMGCARSIDQSAKVEALLQKDREWAAIAEAGDLGRLWAFWDDEAIIYLPGGKAVRGLDEIKEFVLASRSYPEFAIGWKPEGAVVSKSGDLGYTYGFGERTIRGQDGKPITIADNYVSIWR
ncbi:MAG: YybH family protein, partial [Planctomycetota bacterium]